MPLSRTLLRSSVTSVVAAAACTAVVASLAPTPAQADGGSGVVRGTVLETGHVIAPGIDVSLYLASGEFVAATVTNSQAGAYAFTDLKAGSYLLWFENQNEAVSEWYDNQPDKPQATPITLGAGATYVADAYLTQVSENLSAPTVSGAATVGSTLTAGRGTWFPTASVEFRYQWWRGATAIEGATQSSYTLREADSGSRISVEVIAVVQGASESATSQQTATVTGGTPPTQTITSSSAPVITGSTTVGTLLTTTAGTFSPGDATVTLEWLRSGSVVGTGPTYTTGPSDVGATLTVRATATKTGWVQATRDSAAFGPVVPATPVTDPPVTGPLATDPPVVAIAPVSTAAPSVTGTARVGATLTANPGSWSGSPTAYGFQWIRDGAPIAGATDGTLTLTAADAGRVVGVRVTAVNAGGSGQASASAGEVARATSRVTASTRSPRRGRLALTIAVASPGTRTGELVVTVKVGGRSVSRTVAAGKSATRIVVKGLRSGRAKITVRYSGDASTAPSRLTKKATVR